MAPTASRRHHRVWFRSYNHGIAEDTRTGVDVFLPADAPVEEIVSEARIKNDPPLSFAGWVPEEIQLLRRDLSQQSTRRIKS